MYKHFFLSREKIYGLKLKLSSRYKEIGRGCSRVVYDLENGLVIKVAFNEIGIQQNINEHKIFKKAVLLNDGEAFCPILFGSSKIILMPKVETWKEYNMEALEKYMESPGLDFIAKYKEWNRYYEKLYAILFQYVEIPNDELEMLRDENGYDIKIKHVIDHLINCYDLSAEDLCRISSWGLYRDNYVLIDYGLSTQIASQYHVGFNFE